MSGCERDEESEREEQRRKLFCTTSTTAHSSSQDETASHEKGNGNSKQSDKRLGIEARVSLLFFFCSFMSPSSSRASVRKIMIQERTEFERTETFSKVLFRTVDVVQ